MGRLRFRHMIPMLAAIAFSPASAGAEDLPVRIQKYAEGRYSLVARGTTLAEVAGALAPVADCRCRVDEKLRDRPLSLDFGPRSLERLVLALARAAGARLAVSYRLEPIPSGPPAHPGRRAFVRHLVQVEGPMPKPLRAATADLGVPVEVAEEVGGKVRLLPHPRPLGEVLDAMARQTRSRWVLVLGFESRPVAIDPSAAVVDRMHEHLSELAQLSTEDRRAELSEKLRGLERLPEAERGIAVQRVATDIAGLGTLLHRVPGEHRFSVGAQVLPVARDYGQALSAFRSRRKPAFQPLFEALHRLDAALRTLQ